MKIEGRKSYHKTESLERHMAIQTNIWKVCTLDICLWGRGNSKTDHANTRKTERPQKQFNIQSLTSNSDKRKKMQQIKDVMKNSEGGVAQKKESLVSNLKTQENNQEIDSGSALQLFLDNILISSIPGIKNSPGKHHIISNVPLSLFLVCFLNLVTLKSHYENNVF